MLKLTAIQRDALRARQFAFPAQRKVPLEKPGHVRNAVSRFTKVQGVSDAERDAAWLRIQEACNRYGVEIQETDWRQLVNT